MRVSTKASWDKVKKKKGNPKENVSAVVGELVHVIVCQKAICECIEFQEKKVSSNGYEFATRSNGIYSEKCLNFRIIFSWGLRYWYLKEYVFFKYLSNLKSYHSNTFRASKIPLYLNQFQWQINGSKGTQLTQTLVGGATSPPRPSETPRQQDFGNLSGYRSAPSNRSPDICASSLHAQSTARFNGKNEFHSSAPALCGSAIVPGTKQLRRTNVCLDGSQKKVTKIWVGLAIRRAFNERVLLFVLLDCLLLAEGILNFAQQIEKL